MASLMRSALDRLKDWAPQRVSSQNVEAHQGSMFSAGQPGSKTMYFNPIVNGLAFFTFLVVVIWAMEGKEDVNENAQNSAEWLPEVWLWFLTLARNAWILLLIVVAYKFWDLKLGKIDDVPEFSNLAYFSMIFTATVAVGFIRALTGPSAASVATFPAPEVISVVLFDYSIHFWAPIAMVAVAMSVMAYRRGLPLSLRFALYPVIGKMCYGVVGDVIEAVAVACTMFILGWILSLASYLVNLEVMRLDMSMWRGVAYRTGDVDLSKGCQIIVILLVTFLVLGVVMAGLQKGICLVAKVAFFAATFWMLSVLFLDDTWYILRTTVQALGQYMWEFPRMAFHTGTKVSTHLTDQVPHGVWQTQGYSIAVIPFAATFLARISKGRRVGPVVFMSVILPTLYNFAFLGFLVSAQMRLARAGKSSLVTSGVAVFFEHIDLYGDKGFSGFMEIVILLAIVLCLLATLDSAVYSIGILTSNGSQEPPIATKAFWAVLLGAFSICLVAGGRKGEDFAVRQTFLYIGVLLALPVAFISSWMGQGLWLACREEARAESEVERKNFGTFLINVENQSFLAVVAPFVPLGAVAERVWGGRMAMWIVVFAMVWLGMFVLLALTPADRSFQFLTPAVFFCFTAMVASLRSATRNKFGITGDSVSDFLASTFAMPWAIGQMAAEINDDRPIPCKQAAAPTPAQV